MLRLLWTLVLAMMTTACGPSALRVRLTQTEAQLDACRRAKAELRSGSRHVRELRRRNECLHAARQPAIKPPVVRSAQLTPVSTRLRRWVPDTERHVAAAFVALRKANALINGREDHGLPLGKIIKHLGHSDARAKSLMTGYCHQLGQLSRGLKDWHPNSRNLTPVQRGSLSKTDEWLARARQHLRRYCNRLLSRQNT